MQASAERAQHVLQVVQKGYRLNGRLLRPARVIVARSQPVWQLPRNQSFAEVVTP